MIRRHGRFTLGADGAEEELADPLHFVPNLPDVMLVFAVALLVALIGYWNVDVASASSGALDTSVLEQIEGDFDSGEQTSSLSGDNYREVGTVYEDTETGDMYLLPD